MKLLLFSAALILLAGFGSQDQQSRTIENDKIKGIICPLSKEWEFMFKDKKPWTPTKAQVLEAEAEIEKYLKAKPPAQSPQLREKLPLYKRQYLGYLADGEQRIFFNFYCTEEPLTCKPVLYEDGGDCFFHITYDVKKKQVVKIEINGVA